MPNVKDISEKYLFDWPDVFADIWNFIAFDGKSVIQPIGLLGTKARTQLKVDGKLHEQERNVAKIWMAGEVRFALLGLENQTVVDEDMLLRVINYDTAKKYIPLFSVERVCALARRPSLHTGEAVFFYARKM